MDRHELRQSILANRQQLSGHDVASQSVQIADHLWGLPIWSTVRTVMAYVAFRNEVLTGGLIEQILASGRRIVLPVSLKKDRELVLYEIANGEDLHAGTYGIMEPNQEGKSPVDPRELDLVLVPGVVFDQQGNRLGYGAGYYDRFLSRCRDDALRIALAFDLQVVDRLPAEPHDQRLDYIVTAGNVLKCPPRHLNCLLSSRQMK